MPKKTTKSKPIKIKQVPLILTLIVIFSLFLAYNLFKSSNTNKITPTTPVTSPETSNIYTNKLMNFSVEVPPDLEIEENLVSVVITDKNKESIFLGRNGTEFENLDDYIVNSKNRIDNNIQNRKQLKINSLDGLVGQIGKEKIYFIYTNHAVYVISTEDENLYSVLDQIAKSFKYINDD